MIDAKSEGKFKGGISELLSLTTNTYEMGKENVMSAHIVCMNAEIEWI